MSDLQEIKKRLNKYEYVEKVLDHIGCSYIKSEQNRELITCQLPSRFNSSNKRSVQVRLNDRLPCNIRTRGDFNGDIFSLVSYIYNDKRGHEIQQNLNEAKKFICELLGWNEYINGSYKKK